MGEHLLQPQAPAVVGTGVLEGGRSWPAGPWDSSDTLTGVVSALAVGEGRARAAVSEHYILLSPLSKQQLLSLPASPSAGDLPQPRPSGRS